MINFDCFQKESEEKERHICANDPEYNATFNYKKNKIITSRYNIITFLPLNLFQQFQRVANAYFLGLVVLQLIPQISSLSPITTILPLVIVLSITAIKDAWDDFHRHKSDNEINNRTTLTLRDGKFEDVKWMNVCVGDIIKLQNNQFVTADILLLSSSDENNLIYIETAELDGETNLKVKQAIPDTGMIGDNVGELSKFDGQIECEAPNEHLHRFIGKLTWNREEYALDNEKILLRGCRVRNTDWCIGIVVFAGPDTKLMQNTGKTIIKRTSIDRLMNRIVWMIFGFLLVLATVAAIANTIWEANVGTFFQLYQPWESYRPTIYMSGFLTFWSYIIILNTVVPISLYVSVEVIRLFQSMFISWDREMYYEKKDLPADVRTTTLNEELGQIEYIFSDKTGTLTQNVMVFRKCSINGVTYGSIYDDQGNRIDPSESTPEVDLSYNPYAQPTFKYYDETLVNKMKDADRYCVDFFRLIALCNTVMPEYDGDILNYQAQSPDENALVSAARNFGFVFTSRTYNTITVKEMGKDVEYELLAILDFDNVRKRMSVLVRDPTGKITLYCKGADSMIYERLKSGEDEEMRNNTSQHLEDFATDGLRTLCLAKKELTEEEYEGWKDGHEKASKALEEREEKLASVYEEIEKDMTLLGATAIEDKLQDGVPETIANLTNANIKIWVLTGDKQETAINIGYSCNMLTEDMTDVFIISEVEQEIVKQKLQDYRKRILEGSSVQNGVPSSTSEGTITTSVSQNSVTHLISAHFGLVITGQSLGVALDAFEEDFLELATSCTTVICCRVTPLQKAQVVELVKKYKQKVTLSIGDGANDVSMIKAAHIGIGISGEEGTQAVLSSDFAFGQFRYLERLLLVHGRWSYMRMCKFLGYFFYKNFAFTLVHFWFAFFCGFQAQSIYDDWLVTFYNMVYTAMPIIVLALLDQDLNDHYCIRYPKLYLPGQKNAMFNLKIFFLSIIRGILTSLILYFFVYGIYNTGMSPDGQDSSSLQSVGTVIATSLIIIVNLKVAIDTQYWTALNHFFLWGSIAIFFAITFAMYSNGMYSILTTSFPYVGVNRSTMKEGQMWFTVILTTTICIAPEIMWRFYCSMVSPTYTDQILRKQIKDRKERKKLTHKSTALSELHKFRKKLIKKKRPSRPRSGYAFSHERGFGDLITTGRMSTRRKHQSGAEGSRDPEKKDPSPTDENVYSVIEEVSHGPGDSVVSPPNSGAVGSDNPRMGTPNSRQEYENVGSYRTIDAE